MSCIELSARRVGSGGGAQKQVLERGLVWEVAPCGTRAQWVACHVKQETVAIGPAGTRTITQMAVRMFRWAKARSRMIEKLWICIALAFTRISQYHGTLGKKWTARHR